MSNKLIKEFLKEEIAFTEIQMENSVKNKEYLNAFKYEIRLEVLIELSSLPIIN